jgi:hypothetical protein
MMLLIAHSRYGSTMHRTAVSDGCRTTTSVTDAAATRPMAYRFAALARQDGCRQTAPRGAVIVVAGYVNYAGRVTHRRCR